MNKKRWLIVGIAVILVVVSGVSSIGLTNDNETEQVSNLGGSNPLAMLLGEEDLSEEVLEEGSKNERILVVPIEGVIGPADPQYNHELILAAADEVEEDESIKAVVLKVNSGGGAVYQTREVYDRYMQLKEAVDVPIYSSIDMVGASGAYYMSMVADEVYAGPETIVGSIGVITSVREFSDLMEEYGITQETFTSGEFKDTRSNSRKMTDAEREMIQSQIDASYDVFVDVVDQGRPNLDRAQVIELADGRIFSGREAVENGLVDKEGYFRDVIEAVKVAQEIDGAEVFQYEQTGNPFQNLFNGFPFMQVETTPDVKQMMKDIEDMQGMYLEYRWKGAGRYEQNTAK